MGWLNPANWVTAAVNALASTVGKTWVDLRNTEAARQGNENQHGATLAGDYLKSVNDTNRIKAETQTERRVLFALIAFALPTAMHWWAVLLDSIPFYVPYIMATAHKVGSWKVAAPPGAFGVTYHKIIDSFFISGPALAGVSMLARAFRR